MGLKLKQLRVARHLMHAYGQYYGLLSSTSPVTLTYSITGRCQSRCLTCGIGEASQTGQFKKKPDLTIHEIEKIFRSLGPVYFFNISGGEPFLRRDIAEVVDLAVTYLKPAIIHIPTNALMPEKIERGCLEILNRNRQRKSIVPLTVKPSIDGLHQLHDKIRGVPGNFKKLEETIVRLKLIADEYPEFHLELGTVVSKWNVDHLTEIEDYVHAAGVQSYRNEIAEERAEFFNIGAGIAPSADLYKKVMTRFSEQVVKHLKGKKPLTRLTETIRLEYYNLAIRILTEKRQVIPCYGGISNLHLNFDGELWPCCVLGYDYPLGNLRENDYNVQTVIRSKQAWRVLRHIHKKRCFCPLANQWYSNILLHPLTLGRVIFRYFRVDISKERD